MRYSDSIPPGRWSTRAGCGRFADASILPRRSSARAGSGRIADSAGGLDQHNMVYRRSNETPSRVSTRSRGTGPAQIECASGPPGGEIYSVAGRRRLCPRVDFDFVVNSAWNGSDAPLLIRLASLTKFNVGIQVDQSAVERGRHKELTLVRVALRTRRSGPSNSG